MSGAVEQYESRGSAWRITAAVVGTLLGVASILAVIGVLLYVGRGQTTVPGRMSDAERIALLQKHRAADAQELNSYGWVDQSKGIVRIPIAVAMERLVEEAAEMEPQMNADERR